MLSKNVTFSTGILHYKECKSLLRQSSHLLYREYPKACVSLHSDKEITADLAIRTLKKIIKIQRNMDTSKLILHTDQGS